ncbi:MAG TPA: MDR family MFS transporter [Burkholderiales bacterium]
MKPDDLHGAPPEPTVSREEFLNLFASVFLPMFMAAVDQTLLATATPAIAASLGGLRDTSWIAVAYLLASAVVVPVYGRLGDLRGRRNVLLGALALFTAGSLACGFAQSLPQLVAARVVQGAGGGGLMMLSQALIAELVPPRERARFQGYFAIVFTSASVGGPVLGGLVVSSLSWRWLFFANLPLALFAAWRLLRLPAGEKHPGRSGLRDPAGIGLFFVGMSTALFWLTAVGHHFSWRSPESALLLAVAATSLALLAWHQLRHPAPFLPVELMRQRAIAFSVLTTALFASCMFAMVFFLPIYLQLGHHFSPTASGLLLLPLTAGMVTGSITTGRIIARTGRPRLLPVFGLSVSSVALAALGIVPSNTFLVALLGFVTGLGYGTVMPVNQVVAQTAAGRARLGAVTATISLARSVGAATGAALFGALIYAMMPDVDLRALVMSAAGGEGLAQTLLRAFHRAFLGAAVVAALAAFAASRVPHVPLWGGESNAGAGGI